MIRPGDAVIAGISGGVDSVCLLYVLLAFRERMKERTGRSFFLKVIHVEHGLRGAASIEDARFVEALCEKEGVPCQVAHADVASLARAEGLSLEEAARRERYRIFCEACAACESSAGKANSAEAEGSVTAENEGPDTAEKRQACPRVRVAVAHQMEDQAETALFHLARGSGLAGLAGMRPVRDWLIRPLLMFSRNEIEVFVKEKGASWRTDDTNDSPAYTRNRIRHQVIPLLKEQVNARSVEHICEAAVHIREACAYIEAQAEAFACCHIREERYEEAPDDRKYPEKRAAGTTALCLDADAFRAADPLLQGYILRGMIARLKGGEGLKDFGAVHIRDMEQLSLKGSGKRLNLPGGLVCRRRGRQMVLYQIEPNDIFARRRLQRKRGRKEEENL